MRKNQNVPISVVYNSLNMKLANFDRSNFIQSYSPFIILGLFILTFFYIHFEALKNYFSLYSIKSSSEQELRQSTELELFSSTLNILNIDNENGIVNTTEKNVAEKPFTILFWTKWYDKVATEVFGRSACKDILITSEQSEYDKADVVIFQFVDLNKRWGESYPKKRYYNVPWVLALQEAPINLKYQYGSERFNGIFNWTWSFRKDSLIHYDFVEVFIPGSKINGDWAYGSEFSVEFLSNKTKFGAWVVSNCNYQTSDRHHLIQELQRLGLSIDIFGKCGNLTCEKGEKCFEKLGTSYKFYFALENALCEDYITEKINHGLFHGMIPIVYAMGDVQRYAPPKSYINILDYNTINELVNHLRYLDENPKEYFKYFEWRQMHHLSRSDYTCFVWRKLKEYTLKVRNGSEKYRNTLRVFDDWYSYFENERLGKKCLTCLRSEEINIMYPAMNRVKMYNSLGHCKD